MTRTYNNAAFTCTDRRAEAFFDSIYSNMIVHGRPSEIRFREAVAEMIVDGTVRIVHGRPSEIRFREAVAEMIVDGTVRGPLSALTGPLIEAV
jgi:hypothetical protein